MTMNIFIGNLPFSIDQNGLRNIFSSYGEVMSANVISDRETGRSRGFGFVEMEADAARKAIAELNGSEHDGRRIRVNEAEKRERR